MSEPLFEIPDFPVVASLTLGEEVVAWSEKMPFTTATKGFS